MCYGCEFELSSSCLAPCDEVLVVELRAVICDDRLRRTVAVEDVALQEVLNLLGCYGRQGRSFNPFGMIIDAHNDSLELAFPDGKWANQIHSPKAVDPQANYVR